MDKKNLEKYLKMLGSKNEPDVVIGLRGVQNWFKSAGVSLEDALRHAADNLPQRQQGDEKTIDHQPAKKSPLSAIVNASGVPEFRVPQAGTLEIVLSGKTKGDIYLLPGESALHAETISSSLKDAVVAAVINRSRFKLKLLDVRNGNGEVAETALQAEYEREGMMPIRVWTNSRGEAGALAAVLRKAVAHSLPELVVS